MKKLYAVTVKVKSPSGSGRGAESILEVEATSIQEAQSLAKQEAHQRYGGLLSDYATRGVYVTCGTAT